MSKETYRVPVEWDAFQSIMVSAMIEDYKQLNQDFMRVYDTKKGFVFSTDPAEDMQRISAARVSLRDVIEYYGGTVN